MSDAQADMGPETTASETTASEATSSETTNSETTASQTNSQQASEPEEKLTLRQRLFARLPEGLQRSVLIWNAAKQHEQENPAISRKNEELEFLPAAVEILETPASPIGRGLAWTLISLFIIAVAWAWFGHIDVVASANGRIIPVGQVKAIQPLELAKVRAILVKEGEKVTAGQPLIELDPTESEVDVEQVQFQLLEARLNALRLELLLEAVNQPQTSNPKMAEQYASALSEQSPDWPSAPQRHHTSLQVHLLEKDLDTFRSTDRRFQQTIRQQEAGIAAVQAQISRIDALIPLYREQANAMGKVVDQGIVTRLDWLNQEERKVAAIEDRKVLVNQLEEARAQLEAVRQEQESSSQQFIKQRLDELQQNRTTAEQAVLTLRKVESRQKRQRLSAPVDGTVQQLAVHTIGGVVQPAQPIMVIVPADVELEIEATVLNKDIGFVRQGQEAELKVESFPYTRFGLLSGTVRSVSRDAVQNEETGSVYPIRVTMNEDRILVGDNWQRLEPGMNVTVEVKTGQRRLIEFFLAPFLRYQNESFRER